MRSGSGGLLPAFRSWGLLICCAVLFHVPSAESAEEGSPCTIKGNIEGICQASSKCEPRLKKYIETKRLSVSDISSCGLSPFEEIVCCPKAECCDVDQRLNNTCCTVEHPLPEKRRLYSDNQLLNERLKAVFQTSEYLSVNPLPQNYVNDEKKLQPDQDVRPSTTSLEHTNLMIPQPAQKFSPVTQGPSPAYGIQLPETQLSKDAFVSPIIPNHLIPKTNRAHSSEVDVTGDKLNPAFKILTPTPKTPPIWPVDIRSGQRTTTNLPPHTQPTPPSLYQLFPSITKPDPNNEITPNTNMSQRAAALSCQYIRSNQLGEALTMHILDGIPVEAGYYPHMAAIGFDEFGNREFRCGGSLISTRHVLTAAHCVNNQQPSFVRLGTVNIESVGPYTQDIDITDNIVIHENYTSQSKYNDIAILELAKAPKLNVFVYPACLQLNNPTEPGKYFVAGWGVMNRITQATSKILLHAPLSLVDLDRCNQSYAALSVSMRYLQDGIRNTLVCAADENQNTKDACQGDSGGPLTYELDILAGRYTIMGIIAAGFGCATKTPGLYTRVSSFLDFIESNVWPNNVVPRYELTPM